MINWTIEGPLIARGRCVIRSTGSSPRRCAVEQGDPGLEFGVRSRPTPTYIAQLREACVSLDAHRGTIEKTRQRRLGTILRWKFDR